MAYAPINVDAYTNAYSGALAGMAISGWIIDPTSADYSEVATIAGAFARAFDVVWNSATALNWLQIQAIQSVCQEQFAGHAPGSLDNASLAQASNWAVPAAACAALVLQGSAFVTSEGITPNTPGSGGGGGVNQISTTRYVDLNTAVPLADQDGTIGAPFASAIAAVNALKALVPLDGSGTYVLMAFPGTYAQALVWDPAVAGSTFVIANATGLDWLPDVSSGPFPNFLSVSVADGNGFTAKGIIVSDAAGVVCVNGPMQLEGCQVWFAVSSPLGCRFQNCHFVAVDLAVGGGSFLGGTYQSGTMSFPEGNSFMITDTICTATAITFAGAGGTLRIDPMTNFWITSSAPVETGVTKIVMD